MTKLSQLKQYQKVLINIATYISFVFAYIVYGFGLFPAKGFLSIAVNFLVQGLFMYIIFEVISSFTYTIYFRYIPGLAFNQNDYRYYMRVLFIFRNVVISLFNILFIFFPIISIWGIKIVHILSTIAVAVVGLYLVKNSVAQEKYRYYVVTATMLFVYLVAYLFFGVLS